MSENATGGIGEMEQQAGEAWSRAVREKDLQPTVDLTPLPTLSLIEGDRICASCGYNLRQQGVKREPATKLLLVQCPECGKLEPAGDQTAAGSFARIVLIKMLVAVWFWLLFCVAWALAFTFYALAHIAVEIEMYPPSGTGAEVYARAIIYAVAVAAGMLMPTLLFVFLPHWRKALVLGVSAFLIVAGSFAAWLEIFNGTYRRGYYGGTDWGMTAMPFILLVVVLAVGGALLGALVGRHVARGAIRLLVPPSLRPAFAYLWLADGKPLPPMGGGFAAEVVKAVDVSHGPAR